MLVFRSSPPSARVKIIAGNKSSQRTARPAGPARCETWPRVLRACGAPPREGGGGRGLGNAAVQEEIRNFGVISTLVCLVAAG